MSRRQCRRFLECIENFLSQIIDSPKRREAMMDLLVTNVSELISEVKIQGTLACSDHALVEFSPERYGSGKE